MLISFLFLSFGDLKKFEIKSYPNQLVDSLKSFKSEISDFEQLKNISLSDSATISGVFYVNKNNSDSIKYIYIGRVYACYEDGCLLITDFSDSNNSAKLRREFFDYFILFDSVPSVKRVVVYEYKASYGQEIMSAGWLEQFIGYNASNYMFVGEDIDAISGATTSVNAISEDVQLSTNKLKKHLIKK